MQTTTKLLSIAEVAILLGLKYDTVARQYPGYEKYGVRPIRINGNPNSQPRFRSEDIDRMLREWQQV